MNKIDITTIHLGSRFSADVYFDDGVNMFLGARKPAKHYHLACIKRWAVPFLLSEGHELPPEDINSKNSTADEEPAELEELEEVDELEELEQA
ncbi:phosphohydrolase [Treponema sp.]|jgi:hypothetical protein|uniref:phosphohydrolase n=1 Tax=Treponema sp. TaxID=166 RepID=UPI00257951C8|nr:phosphohydrolase [Treponema sp.]MBE6354953.1 phosphohydrolase [Treponema sp.]